MRRRPRRARAVGAVITERFLPAEYLDRGDHPAASLLRGSGYMPGDPACRKRSHGVLMAEVSVLTFRPTARRACQHPRMIGERHHVVVVGGGFGGTRVVEGLAGAGVDVTLV